MQIIRGAIGVPLWWPLRGPLGILGFHWEAWGSSGDPLGIVGVPFGTLLVVLGGSLGIPGDVWGAFVDPWGPYKP